MIAVYYYLEWDVLTVETGEAVKVEYLGVRQGSDEANRDVTPVRDFDWGGSCGRERGGRERLILQSIHAVF